MKNDKLRNSLVAAGVAVLAGVLVFGVSAAIGDVPRFDPPSDEVSPVFSDLEVTGNITTDTATISKAVDTGEISVVKNISVGGDVAIVGMLDVEGQLRIKNDFVNPYSAANPKGGLPIGLPVNINDDLDVTGDVQLGAGAMFGSVYLVNSFTSGTLSFSDSCYSDDILLSCGGYTSAGLKGLYPTQTTCTVYALSSTSPVTAHLTCLDPEGIRTGTNP